MATYDNGSGAHPKAKKMRNRIIGVLIVALVCAGAYAFIAGPWENRPIPVEVETLSPDLVQEVLAVNGRVAARESVDVRSAVSARANHVLVDEGDRVSVGQELVSLDTVQPRTLVAQAQAALEAGEAQQRQALAAAERARALGDVASRSTRENAELELDAATNEVERLRAALEQAQSQLEQYTIYSPLNGVVLERSLDQGQLVDTQSALFTIAEIDNPVVETDVDEVYSARMQTGLTATLKAAGETISRSGTVTFASPRIDPTTGGRAITISFDQPVDLPIGLTVNANIVVAETPDALSVPRRSIMIDGEAASVLVVVDGVAEERSIQFADWPAERVRILEGLSAGDVVILNPEDVTANSKVEIQ